MATISAADIKKLREATGAGMTDCKNALVENDGDYDKAVEYLRIKGLKGVAKREGRAASNGLVTVKTDGTGKATLLELLDQFHDEGRTVVVATHDATFVERVSRCIALRDGEVIHDGSATPQDVLRLVGA